MPLHPQAEQFLQTLAETNPPAWSELPPEEGRAIFEDLTDLYGDGPELERVEDIATATGIPMRLYQVDANATPPVLLYFHGGGFVLGNIKSHDVLCCHLAARSGMAILSVDYRLAPEEPYPAALHDCYDALEFVTKHQQELGIDATSLVVAGDSAGGNLALAVALRSRDLDGPAITGQVLIYPVVGQDYETESYEEFAVGYGLTRDTMKWFWDQYLGEQTADGYADLTRANTLSGLPPAHVITAEYDVLRSEGEQLVKDLIAAGVSTTHQQYEGMLHGFIHFSGAFETGLTAIADISEFLRKMTPSTIA